MGLLEQLFESRVVEERASLSLKNYQQWVDLGLTSRVASGIQVSPGTAMQHSAVYACVRILSETIASLPLIIYERQKRGKRRAKEHYLYSILKDKPNDMMTSFEFREVTQSHRVLWGNAYSHIDYDGAGRVRELFPLRPDRMIKIEDAGNERSFWYQLPGGEVRKYPQSEIWHQRGLGGDGRIGYSPIKLARQSIGLGMAAEEFGARFFGNDARPGGVLVHPGSLSPEAQDRMRESWASKHGGLDKSHKVAILEEGLTYQEIGIPPEDAQFIETRKFQIQEVARIYRIPPHMLADLERATFSNIEHQSIEFVMHTIRPWLVRWEQSISQNLMLEKDRKRYYPEFLVEGLLRGDITSRYQAYATARQNGWMSANDIRELENMNPVDGGDVYLVPLNMIPANEVGGFREDQSEPETRAIPDIEMRSAAQRQRLAKAYRGIFVDATRRILRREINDISNQAKKLLSERSREQFEEWLEVFYEEHKAFVRKHMRPAFATYGEVVSVAVGDEVALPDDVAAELDSFIDEYVETFAARYVQSSEGQIKAVLRRAIIDGDDPVEALTQKFGEWEDRRPDKLADWEANRSNNAFAHFLYGAAGILTIRWVTVGKSCPYCSSLNGTTVGIKEFFFSKDDEYKPKGADKPLTFSGNVGHPPAHPGCDCMTVASVG